MIRNTLLSLLTYRPVLRIKIIMSENNILLLDFPTNRSKSERYILAKEESQEDRIASYRERYGKSVSEHAVVRDKHNAIESFLRKCDKQMTREVKPEKWSCKECQYFWRQIDGSRSSYNDYFSMLINKRC